jgi:hypothetical protein
VAVSESIRNPISNSTPPASDQTYSGPLNVLPAITSRSTHSEAISETNTPAIVTQWVRVRPRTRPSSPATIAPASGANGTSRYAVFIIGVVFAGAPVSP